ncbi:hypothetical protein Tco_0659271 [Tanacetum coccineum]
MVINSPCLIDKKEFAIPGQTTTGKEFSNPLMADSLPKTILPTKYALTVNPTIYVSFIEQFWQTATVETVNDGEQQITVIVDGQTIAITEASVRRHLQLADADGISSLPNTKIFEQLTLMGYVSNDDKLTFQKGEHIPLFDSMLIHDQPGQGEGPTLTVESQHTPIASSTTLQPTTSQPMSSQEQPSQVPTTEPIITTSSPPLYETSIPYTTSSMPHDSPLSGGDTPGSDDDNKKLNELTELYTKLSDKVTSLEEDLKQTKKVYGKALTKIFLFRIGLLVGKGIKVTSLEDELASTKAVYNKAHITLTKRVKKLEKWLKHKRRRAVIGILRDCELGQKHMLGKSHDTTKHRMESEHDDDDDRTLAETLLNIKRSAAKGKAITQESEPPKKIKKKEMIQMSLDEEFAKSFYEEEQAQILQDEPSISFELLWKQSQPSKILVWVRKFISGLCVVPIIEEPIKMYCDNTGAIVIANESGITKGARHFHAKVHYLCKVIEYGDIKLEKVHTYDNLADPFTKALACLKHSEHTKNIEMFPANNVWKNQQGLVKVLNWKLYDSCGVHCVTMQSIPFYLLVEKIYPLTNHTLHQMFNDVKLQVDYECEMAFELLRLVNKQLKEGYVPE